MKGENSLTSYLAQSNQIDRVEGLPHTEETFYKGRTNSFKVSSSRTASEGELEHTWGLGNSYGRRLRISAEGPKSFKHQRVRAKNTILQASELSEALGSSGIQGREPAVKALARQRLHGAAGETCPSALSVCLQVPGRGERSKSSFKVPCKSLRPSSTGFWVRAPKPSFPRQVALRRQHNHSAC